MPIINPDLDRDTLKKPDVGSPDTNSLEMIAAEIKKHQTSFNGAYLEIGRLLLAAKAKFGKHGEWTNWFRDNVDMSICKGQRLMRVAEWMDEKKAPELFLDFSKAYILCRLSDADLKKFLEGKQIDKMSKRELQKAVCDYLKQKANQTSTVAVTTQPKATATIEEEFHQRSEKIRDHVARLADLIKGNPGEYGLLATELRDFIVQQLSPEDE